MRSARYTAYGPPDTIVIDEVPIPDPGPGEVLVRVHAAPVTAGDVRLRSGRVPRGLRLPLRLALGLTRPRIAPGWAFAGTVAGLGPGATGLAPGEPVFGLTGVKGGAHRDYLTIPATGRLLPMPGTLGMEEGAAFFFGGLTAAEFLIDRARLARGERLLVCGATGAVGGAAVQIGRHLGATVAATASLANHGLARDLGATRVTDYRAPPPEGPFDVILDVMGRLGWSNARRMLAAGGRYIQITADLWQMLGAGLFPQRGDKRILVGTNKDDLPAMRRLLALHQAGGYRPVIGSVLPFADLAQAHALAESFHKPGNIVLAMAS